MSFVRSLLAAASCCASWSSLGVVLLTAFPAAACSGTVEQGGSGDQSISQPDDETTEVSEADTQEGSSLGDAARQDDVADVAVCEAFTAQVCRLQMRYWEGAGEIDTTLEVRREGERRLTVTDGPGLESAWDVVVEVGLDGTLETDAGVPKVTCEHLVEKYTEEGPETYEPVAGYPCSEADAALIRFFVREWFYFG
jgi:hypothetical protein